MQYETIKLLAGTAAVVWLLVLGLAFAFQDRLLYGPDSDARPPFVSLPGNPMVSSNPEMTLPHSPAERATPRSS